MKPGSYHGRWFRPRSPERAAVGTLELSEDAHVTLKLFESQGDRDLSPIPILVGNIVGGRPITLLDCNLTESTSSAFSDDSVSTYVPGRLLIGEAFESIEDVRFQRAACDFNYLLEWLGPASLKSSLHKIESIKVAPIRTSLGEGQIVIHRMAKSRIGIFQSSLEEAASVAFEAPLALTIDEWHERYFHPFANLLTLATGRPNLRDVVHLWPVPSEVTPNEVPIELIEKRWLFSSREAKSFSRADMYFRYEDIESAWPAIIKRWYEMTRTAGSAINVYFSVVYNEHSYIEEQFSNIVEALEGYHRSTRDNREVPDADHTRRLDAVLGSAPPEHREWLDTKLRFSNEPSLRKRLTDLIEASGDALEPFLRDRGAFLQKVLATRNYLVHHNADLRQRSIPLKELWAYTFVLSMLMRATLLRDVLGDAGCARRFLAQSKEYRFQTGRIKLP